MRLTQTHNGRSKMRERADRTQRLNEQFRGGLIGQVVLPDPAGSDKRGGTD